MNPYFHSTAPKWGLCHFHQDFNLSLSTQITENYHVSSYIIYHKVLLNFAFHFNFKDLKKKYLRSWQHCLHFLTKSSFNKLVIHWENTAVVQFPSFSNHLLFLTTCVKSCCKCTSVSVSAVFMRFVFLVFLLLLVLSVMRVLVTLPLGFTFVFAATAAAATVAVWLLSLSLPLLHFLLLN